MAVPKCINRWPHRAFEPFPQRIYLFWVLVWTAVNLYSCSGIIVQVIK